MTFKSQPTAGFIGANANGDRRAREGQGGKLLGFGERKEAIQCLSIRMIDEADKSPESSAWRDNAKLFAKLSEFVNHRRLPSIPTT
jgi:hypothetical protein